MLENYCILKDIDIIDHITKEYSKGKKLDRKAALRVLDLYPHIYACASQTDFSPLSEDSSDDEFAAALVRLRTVMMDSVK